MALRKNSNQILIAGGGVAGLSTALALHKLGLKNLTVLEQADSLRVTGASLTIWDNGWKALDALGVGDILRSKHTKLQSVETLSASRGSSKSLDLRGHEVRCVKRKELLEVLAGALPPKTIEFGSRISDIHETRNGDSNNSVTVELDNGSCFSPKVCVIEEQKREAIIQADEEDQTAEATMPPGEDPNKTDVPMEPAVEPSNVLAEQSS